MAGRPIDIVASGPASSDLYDLCAPAWALAAGLAVRGHSVQVTYPGPADPGPVPAGVATAPFSPVTAHVGTALGDAELARAAARHLRPAAQAVVRDPSGLGALGHHAAGRPVVAFVRSLGEDGPSPPAGTPGGVGAKLFAWGERRGARRLEKEALVEATVVCCASSSQRERLRAEYGVAPERIRVVPLAVASGPEPPTREAARRLLSVPDDVPLVAVLPPVEAATTTAAIAPAVEAFKRTRPIFTGARLAVVGVAEQYGPGIASLPGRDAATITSAVTAADVVIATSTAGPVDPGVVLALRVGTATVVGPGVSLGDGGEAVVRRTPLTDAGELASVLAELVADPEARRSLGERARSFAQRFDAAHLAEELESAGALGPV